MAESLIEVIRVEIAKMALAPGEVLVAKLPGSICAEEAAHLAQEIQKTLPTTPLLICSDDIVFSTISQSVLCEECRAKV